MIHSAWSFISKLMISVAKGYFVCFWLFLVHWVSLDLGLDKTFFQVILMFQDSNFLFVLHYWKSTLIHWGLFRLTLKLHLFLQMFSVCWKRLHHWVKSSVCIYSFKLVVLFKSFISLLSTSFCPGCVICWFVYFSL